MAFYIQAAALKPPLFSIVFLLWGGGGHEKEVSPWSLPSVWDCQGIYGQGLDGRAKQIRWKVPEILFFY